MSDHPSLSHTMAPLTTRKVIAGVLVILSVVILFVLFYHFRALVILAFSGIVISISMVPAVDWLHQHKLPRAFSVILIYLGLMIVFLVIIFLVIPQTIQQLTGLIPRFEDLYQAIKSGLQSSPDPIFRQWVGNLPESLRSIFSPGAPGTGEVVLNSIGWTLNIAQSILEGFFTLSVILLFGLYWTLEGERMEYAFSLLLPVEKRESQRAMIKDIETRVGGFVRGQGFLAIAVGAMALAAYVLIGLPSVLSLGFLAGVCELIPVIGPVLGAIPAVMIAIGSDPSKIIWVIIATSLIQLFENHFLSPRIMQKTVGINPIGIILAIVGFGSLFGFPGILMAIPLAAVAQIGLDRLLLNPTRPKVEAPAGRDSLSKLSYEAQEFVQDVRKLVRRKEAGMAREDHDEIEDAIESIATDLDGLLAQSAQAENSP